MDAAASWIEDAADVARVSRRGLDAVRSSHVGRDAALVQACAAPTATTSSPARCGQDGSSPGRTKLQARPLALDEIREKVRRFLAEAKEPSACIAEARDDLGLGHLETRD
jgi:hypothetical protein